VKLLLSLLLVSSSTSAGGLFSNEEIPDQVSSGGGLFSSEEVPSSTSPFEEDASLALPASFQPKVRSTIELFSEARVDTAFDKENENVLELRLSGKFSLDVDFADKLSAYIAPGFAYQAAWTESLDDRGFLFLQIPEAYITWGSGRTYLRVGTQVFNWGTSDFAAPADVLNPTDLRRGLVAGTDPTANKIPVLAVEGVTGIGPFTIKGVIQPFFTPSRFFLSGWDDSIGAIAGGGAFAFPDLSSILGPATSDHIGDQLLLTDRPQDRPDSATFAARATLQLDTVDLSMTAVHGWENLPRVQFEPALAAVGAQLIDSIGTGQPIDPFAAAPLFDQLNQAIESGRPLLEGSYERRTLIGMDASIALDPFILKLDVAYTFERTLYTQDFFPVTRPWLNSTIGLEYIMGDELQILTEVFALTVMDVRSNERLQLIEPISAPPSTMDIAGKERSVALGGAIAAIRYNMLDGDLNLDLVAVTTLNRGDWFFLPALNYKLSDNQKISLSAFVIEGKDRGYGALFSHNDRVQLGYTWSM